MITYYKFDLRDAIRVPEVKVQEKLSWKQKDG